MPHRFALTSAATLAILGPATAQIHIDIGAQAGTPASGYRAADDALPPHLFPVVWNTVPANASAVPSNRCCRCRLLVTS